MSVPRVSLFQHVRVKYADKKFTGTHSDNFLVIHTIYAHHGAIPVVKPLLHSSKLLLAVWFTGAYRGGECGGPARENLPLA
jgi:hypothetical protein